MAAKWLALHFFDIGVLSIYLNVNDDSSDELEKSVSVPGSIPKLPNLLQLNCCPPFSRSECSSIINKWVNAILFEHSAKLQVLSLSIGALDLAPPMLQLNHLLLKTREMISDECWSSLSSLPCLQTLLVEGSRLWGSELWKGQEYVVNMRGCVQLQSVCFATMLPLWSAFLRHAPMPSIAQPSMW